MTMRRKVGMPSQASSAWFELDALRGYFDGAPNRRGDGYGEEIDRRGT